MPITKLLFRLEVNPATDGIMVRKVFLVPQEAIGLELGRMENKIDAVGGQRAIVGAAETFAAFYESII